MILTVLGRQCRGFICKLRNQIDMTKQDSIARSLQAEDRGEDHSGESLVEQRHAESHAAHLFAEVRHNPDEIRDLFREGTYPYKNKIKGSAYEKHKKELQVELLKVQNWVKQTGQRIVVIMEGRDAAGKGGTIKRFMEHLNPRAARVVALEKPTELERGQWYFQRYVSHLPTRGEMVFFDRSWYNRAGVERVMGFCNSLEYLEFMRQVPDLERMLTRSGIRVLSTGFPSPAMNSNVVSQPGRATR